jgi:hypothetical protein
MSGAPALATVIVLFLEMHCWAQRISCAGTFVFVGANGARETATQTSLRGVPREASKDAKIIASVWLCPVRVTLDSSMSDK